VVLLLLLAAAAAFYLVYRDMDAWSPEEFVEPETSTPSEPTTVPEEEPSPTPETPKDEEDIGPHGKLVITKERQAYESGDLTLVIPKLSIDAAVQNGTTSEDLKKGACLYEPSGLPGEGDVNVSIAAHRNGRKNGKVTVALFYYIDTLEEGDYLYLTDGAQIYRYLYYDTKVVEDDDWGPIYKQGFSCLTLTSCEPIGVSTHRIIVRAKLDEIFPYDKDFSYEQSSKEA